MLSSFVTRDFGYKHNFTPAQLLQINQFLRGRKYLDEDAAVEIYAKKEKQELTESLCIRWLEYD